MKHLHTGLVTSNKKKADRFFIDILGLEKAETKTLDPKLAEAIFGIKDELIMLRYQGGNVDYEVFVYPAYKAPEMQIAHSCVQVANLATVVSNCRDLGLKVVQVPKGTGVVTFVADYDGNLFEMKEI